MPNISTIIDEIVSAGQAPTMIIPKIAATALALVFLIFIIYVLKKTPWFQLIFLYPCEEFFSKKPCGVKKARHQLKKLKKKIKKGGLDNYQKAIIEVDNIIADLIKKWVVVYQAKTFEQKLELLGDLDEEEKTELLKARQFVEELKQNKDYVLDPEQARQSFSFLEHILAKLLAL